MKQDKLYNILLDLYREVYKSIGVDFDTVDKVKEWFWEYEIEEVIQDKLINEFLNSRRLSVLEKRVIKSSYYIGCSPKIKKI